MINSSFTYRGHSVKVCGHAGSNTIDAFGSIESIDGKSWMGWIHAFSSVAEAVTEAKSLLDEAEGCADGFLKLLAFTPACPKCGRETKAGLLKSGLTQYTCRNSKCRKKFTPEGKHGGYRGTGQPGGTPGAERVRKSRERTGKSGNEARDAKKNMSAT
jgi:hypothetical protein